MGSPFFIFLSGFHFIIPLLTIGIFVSLYIFYFGNWIPKIILRLNPGQTKGNHGTETRLGSILDPFKDTRLFLVSQGDFYDVFAGISKFVSIMVLRRRLGPEEVHTDKGCQDPLMSRVYVDHWRCNVVTTPKDSRSPDICMDERSPESNYKFHRI